MRRQRICHLTILAILSVPTAYAKEIPPDPQRQLADLDAKFQEHLNSGEHAEAEAVAREMVAFVEQIEQPNPVFVLASYDRLGIALELQRRFTEAVWYRERLLAEMRRQYADDDPRLLHPISRLAALQLVTNQLEEARDLCHRGLEIAETKLGPRVPQVAALADSLGLTEFQARRYDAAVAAFEKSIRIREWNGLAEAPDHAERLSKLGMAYSSAGQHDKAELVLLRALKLAEASYDGTSPQVTHVLNCLGSMYRNQGKYQDSKDAFRRCLDGIHERHGEDHPQSLIVLHNLALLHLTHDQPAEAELAFARRDAIIDRHSMEPHHPDYWTREDVLIAAKVDRVRVEAARKARNAPPRDQTR